VISDEEFDKANLIMQRLSDLYNFNAIEDSVAEKINQLTLDVNWLYDRLNVAWAMVNAYQEEIRESTKRQKKKACTGDCPCRQRL
jgi:hypothetical protein